METTTQETGSAELAAFRAALEAETQAGAAYDAARAGNTSEFEAARATYRAACALTRVWLRELVRALGTGYGEE